MGPSASSRFSSLPLRQEGGVRQPEVTPLALQSRCVPSMELHGLVPQLAETGGGGERRWREACPAWSPRSPVRQTGGQEGDAAVALPVSQWTNPSRF